MKPSASDLDLPKGYEEFRQNSSFKVVWSLFFVILNTEICIYVFSVSVASDLNFVV